MLLAAHHRDTIGKRIRLIEVLFTGEFHRFCGMKSLLQRFQGRPGRRRSNNKKRANPLVGRQ